MFKLKCNNTILSEHQSLFEAKKQTLLNLKTNPTLKLIEVLDDDNKVVFTDEVELEEPTQEQVEIGNDTLIRNLITRCWDTISEYESAIATLTDKDVDPTTFDILKDLVDDEYQHIGQLTSCLSNYEE